MRNFKIGVKFDIKLLNKLKNDSNSGVEIHNKKHHLALHPIHLNDFNKSIKDVLSAGIAKYNKNLGGILLGYENIKLPVDIGLINYDSCYIHMDLEADFFVFKPEIDKEMQGVVNRKSKDHVGVLVYNVFNVSLPQPQTHENWLGSSVNIGDEVLFRITYMNLSSYLPYIKGELISILSTTAVNNIADKYSINHKKRANKKIIFNDEQSPEEKKGHVGKLSENKHKNKEIKFDTSEEIAQDQMSVSQKKRKRKLDENVQEGQILEHQVQKKRRSESKIEENIGQEQPEQSISQVQKKRKCELDENGQDEQILEHQVQKKRRSESKIEENMLQEQPVPQVQKKKKHRNESGLEENLLEEHISVTQIQKKKKKHKEESELEQSVSEEQILVYQVQKKKKKHKKESELEENATDKQIPEPQAQKAKKYEMDEDTRIQKKSKKKKEKVRKEKGLDDSSITEFNLSELFNETKVSVRTIKTEIDSDENLENGKSSQRGYFKNSGSSHYLAEADSQNIMKEKKSKTKKEKLWDEADELPREVGKIKYEHSSNELGSFKVNAKSKKSNKRSHSFAESP